MCIAYQGTAEGVPEDFAHTVFSSRAAGAFDRACRARDNDLVPG